jgi:hypothetical protein
MTMTSVVTQRNIFRLDGKVVLSQLAGWKNSRESKGSPSPCTLLVCLHSKIVVFFCDEAGADA